ncbi:hypothetical protein YC2023_120485 [Brassica napus]
MRGGRGRSGLGSSSKRRSSVRPIPLPWAFNKILREEFQRYGGQTAPDNVSEIEAFSEELEKMEAVKETRMKKAKGASDVNISSFAVDNVNLNKRGEVDLEPSLPGTKPEKSP